MRQENAIFKRYQQANFYGPTLTRPTKVDNLLEIGILCLGFYGEKGRAVYQPPYLELCRDEK
jgi:hypothetical protein